MWGGTGANVVSLACLLRASDAVICTDSAHIHVDEAGAPGAHGRHQADRASRLPTASSGRSSSSPTCTGWATSTTRRRRSCRSRSRPRPARCTRPTRSRRSRTRRTGTACCVHVDGARIANAVAALGSDLRAATIDAGVDVLSFGGTKNGMMYGEAVVFCRPELADNARAVRKQLAQLPSKARYISAQLLALLEGDLWLESGDARERHGRAARDEGRRSAGRAAVAPPGGQQRVRAVAARRDQGTAGVVLLLHVGRGRARSALDDGVGHQSGGRRGLRRRVCRQCSPAS